MEEERGEEDRLQLEECIKRDVDRGRRMENMSNRQKKWVTIGREHVRQNVGKEKRKKQNNGNENYGQCQP